MKHQISPLAVFLILFSSITYAAQADNKENDEPMPCPFARTHEDIDAALAYLDRQFARHHPQSEWFTSTRRTQEQPPVRRHHDNLNENPER